MKEAAYKALYPIVTPTWKEFTYRGFEATERRKPSLKYHPFQPHDVEKIGRIHVSVSHDGDFVVASVIVEADN